MDTATPGHLHTLCAKEPKPLECSSKRPMWTEHSVRAGVSQGVAEEGLAEDTELLSSAQQPDISIDLCLSRK